MSQTVAAEVRTILVMITATAGRARAVLIAITTALVSGLLLQAAAILRLSREPDLDAGYAHVFTPLQTRGTLGGDLLGVVLLTVPLLALLNQTVRLGTGARERRFAALRVAGATTGDLRRWGAVEVGAPAALGACLGIAVWWLLRRVLGEGLADSAMGALVPATSPGGWTPVVVLVVAGLGALIGLRTPSGGRPPRPVRFPALPLVLLAAGVAVLYGAVFTENSGGEAQAVVVLVPLAFAGGMAGLTTWLAQRAAGLLGRRAWSAPALLAARRLQGDPRPAARAALAAGAAGLTNGVCGVLLAEEWGDHDGTRATYAYPAALVAGLACLAIVLVGISLAVHVTDSVLTERRAYAALSATGFPVRGLVAALRWEALLAALPVALLGSLLGSLASARGPDRVSLWLPWAAAAVGTTLVVSVATVFAVSGVLAPVVRDAVGTGTLRTE